MDKTAIISDIHGNLEALKSVLDDIKERNINRIFCLGDIIAKGTHQQECVDLVKENCEVILRGNCDEYFTSNIDLLTKTQSEVDRIIWNKNKLNEETRKYLSNLPYCYEFYMSGRFVRLVHAHPEKIDKFAGNIDKIDRLYELFLPSSNTISDKKADILIYGHIHTQYVQKIYNRMIINLVLLISSYISSIISLLISVAISSSSLVYLCFISNLCIVGLFNSSSEPYIIYLSNTSCFE